MEGEKTFYNIGKLSEECETKMRELVDPKTGSDLRIMDTIQVWQVHWLSAIAQQLSVISGTLSDLLALCKSQNKSKK